MSLLKRAGSYGRRTWRAASSASGWKRNILKLAGRHVVVERVVATRKSRIVHTKSTLFYFPDASNSIPHDGQPFTARAFGWNSN